VTTASSAVRTAMRDAIALAARGQGETSPNPVVGCVVLDAAGERAGEGYHPFAGGPHAEAAALERAGERARGGTVVVTLEPCDHHGRTGPCTQAILDAGVRRVVYAVADPSERARGGARRLAEAGVEVESGLLAAEAEHVNAEWLTYARLRRPHVTWKFAATLDGRVAAADLTSRWISSPASRADVHALRATVDAILVGSGTVLADDPHLTVRDGDGLAEHQPLRVVLDRRHRVPPDARVLDAVAETVVLDTAAPQFAVKALYDRGVRHVLLEGGPTLAGAFVEARCVDEVVAYLAPVLLGAGPAALGDAGIGTLADAATLDVESVSRIGDDVKLVARPRWADHATEE
jgi:diaminohydroxyphosphoribosylaminopyrimidine deaminase/5-amino-6-(5-phosphoribosylamino)uracil reductase